MIKFFKKIRIKLLSENKFSKYLIYAIGEIILVVIGILIALSINNWNEKQKQKNKLNEIYLNVINDITTNIDGVQKVIDFIESNSEMFDKVMQDSLVEDDVINGRAAYLLTGYQELSIEKSGFQELAQMNANDSLSIIVLKKHNYYSKYIERLELAITSNMYNTLKDWRDNYAWFPEFVSGDLNKEAIDYFLNSQDYRNKIAYHFVDVYVDYLNVLKSFQIDMGRIRKELNQKLINK
ncbi:hypothetical protein [Marinifilum flexuosum]|uniref:Uncharacterized protein n=1 Tax=Marinifilum flexuosum TaxID=1117708 RepID=A0A419XAT8_9BACT|nr:hypothetical protein [Marinifilum flexuosum]RKE04825.1 hypothetical protein BXY64_1854 [Marinifilum flexuosum]